jgi:hypothetical protein
VHIASSPLEPCEAFQELHPQLGWSKFAANTAVLKVVEVKTLPEGSFQFSFESKGDTAPLGGQGSKQGQVAYAAAASLLQRLRLKQISERENQVNSFLIIIVFIDEVHTHRTKSRQAAACASYNRPCAPPPASVRENAAFPDRSIALCLLCDCTTSNAAGFPRYMGRSEPA